MAAPVVSNFGRPLGSGMERWLYDCLQSRTVSGPAEQSHQLAAGDIDVHQAESRDGAAKVGIDPDGLERRNPFLEGVESPALLHPGDDYEECANLEGEDYKADSQQTTLPGPRGLRRFNDLFGNRLRA